MEIVKVIRHSTWPVHGDQPNGISGVLRLVHLGGVAEEGLGNGSIEPGDEDFERASAGVCPARNMADRLNIINGHR